MALPTELDLAAKLVAAGIIDAIPEAGTEQYLALTRALASAEYSLKTETGWDPYEGTAQTRYFTGDGTSNRLFLDQGLLEVIALEIDSTAYDLDTSFYYGPTGATPYTYLDFTFSPSSLRNGIAIEGIWGRVNEYDDAADHALLCYAAIVAGAELRGVNAASGTLVEIVQGPVRQKYADADGGAMFGTFQTWQSVWESYVRLNKRFYV